MALTPAVKAAVDAMNITDRALLAMYVFGTDDTSLIATMGTRAVQARAAYLTNPTNAQKALALLLDMRDYTRNQFAEREAVAAARAAQQAARAAALAAVQFADIGSLPEPEGS